MPAHPARIALVKAADHLGRLCRRQAAVALLPRPAPQALLAQARADAATRLAEAIGGNPAAAEALRLLLASDWMAMGEQMAQAPGGSVLMVDPQSPAALLTALRNLQQGQG